jgi:RHS repeat-associated protein
VAKLNAGGAAPLGPLKQLAVQKGDTVTVTAPGLYPQKVQRSFWFSLASFLTGLLQPAPSLPAPPDAVRRGGLPLLQVGVAAGLASVPQLGGGVPKGYVRVLVFDADSILISQHTQQLSSAALNNYESLRLQVVVPQDGYVTAYVGNESNVDVLFDDVTVEHRPGLQVQENHYDPWGLSLAGLDYRSPGLKPLNQFQFNGKERQNDLGLNWQDYGARFYDSQVPRFTTPDPLAAKHAALSPYNYVGNNPTNGTDPDGRDFILNVIRNKDGDITGVDISATVYIKGAGASAKRASELTKFAGDNLKHKKAGDVVVSIGVTYQYDADKEQGDLKEGENLLTFNDAPESSENKSEVFGATATETNNVGVVQERGLSNSTVLHETLHFMGLSDRYDERQGDFDEVHWRHNRASKIHTGFEGDRMATPKGTSMDAWHYLQYKIYGESMPKSSSLIKAYPSKRFVDRDEKGLRTPYESSGYHQDNGLKFDPR